MMFYSIQLVFIISILNIQFIESFGDSFDFDRLKPAAEDDGRKKLTCCDLYEMKDSASEEQWINEKIL